MTPFRAAAALLCVAVLCGQDAPPTDAREIVRRAVARDEINENRARDYTFIQRQEIRRLDKKGAVKKVESDTYEVLIVERQPFRRKIARDDQPLEGKEKEKAEKEFDKELRERLGKDEDERRRKIAEWEKERAEEREFLKEIPEAYDFTLVGEENLNARAAWVLDAIPRPAFKARTKFGKNLPKFRGRLWIDKSQFQLVKVEAESVDTVSMGWFVARLAPGARMSFENAYVNGEVWLPRQVRFGGAARVMLVRKMAAEVTVDFRDYRKFQSDSRVVSTDSVPAPERSSH
ncbi:MAG: hypothetical protein KIT09_16975 [Bryobacteraceae bacterium]|nr:hypothetical protein [Bryobacteraceae bacterium]